ncbi:MAG: ORF6N domain-containing protein [Mariniphaga sp.]|nr:ORF6N domain-containing protein [Mariniphaga sp.]
MQKQELIIEERITKAIYLIRDQKVMLDSDLANLYGVETKVLKRAVRRNINRFPEDFMFELTKEEWENLRSHFGTSSEWGGTRYPPFVFTEQGVAMLSSVLNSQTAIQVNISIMRVFVKMRQWAANYEELVKKIDELQDTQTEHNQHIANIYRMIEELVRPAISTRNPIGYKIK